jgi:hypothetical protein
VVVDTPKSKTIHVDFKNRSVVKVDEVESCAVVVKKKKSAMESLFDGGFFSMKETYWGEGEFESATESGLVIDPAAYLDMVISKFDEHLDDRGCFDEKSYKDPQVLADAIHTFSILQREIPMMTDTMMVLRELITKQTGTDPVQSKKVKLKVKK